MTTGTNGLMIPSDQTATAKALISMSSLSKQQIRREMDVNYLAMLVQQHPTLDKKYFIDFIDKCQMSGANPRMNQVYLIAHNSWSSETKSYEMKGTTVFSYQFFLKLAQQTGQLEEFGVDVVEDKYLDVTTGKAKPSLTAIAWAKRKGHGKITYKARLWEFAKTSKEGALSGNWKASPYLMLEKCAVSNVIRWAFPETFGGFFTDDEINLQPSPIATTPAAASPALTGAGAIDHTTLGQESKLEAEIPFVMEPMLSLPEAQQEVKQPQQDIDDLRNEILDFCEFTNDQFFERIGRSKEDIRLRVAEEKEFDKIKAMHSWLTKASGFMGATGV